ncbi:GntR family transcriptional regulator [Nonomuraea sp. NPDC003201]
MTSAPVPPSRRLVEDLRVAITSGRPKPGDPLPSEQELMDTYGLRKLRQEGLIQHRPGPGSPRRAVTAGAATGKVHRIARQSTWSTERRAMASKPAQPRTLRLPRTSKCT